MFAYYELMDIDLQTKKKFRPQFLISSLGCRTFKNWAWNLTSGSGGRIRRTTIFHWQPSHFGDHDKHIPEYLSHSYLSPATFTLSLMILTCMIIVDAIHDHNFVLYRRLYKIFDCKTNIVELEYSPVSHCSSPNTSSRRYSWRY